jgi:hypothetical protein
MEVENNDVRGFGAGHLQPRLPALWARSTSSDGLGTHWSLDAYPGLSGRHPTLIAAVLYRDFDRGRDDVSSSRADCPLRKKPFQSSTAAGPFQKLTRC